MSQLGDILEGHMNELLHKQEDISFKRLQICDQCPIVNHTVLGMMCDSNKWINKNDEVSFEAKEGFTRGCGCRMSAKSTLEQAHCIIGKW